jgi:hypothetical protein
MVRHVCVAHIFYEVHRPAVAQHRAGIAPVSEEAQPARPGRRAPAAREGGGIGKGGSAMGNMLNVVPEGAQRGRRCVGAWARPGQRSSRLYPVRLCRCQFSADAGRWVNQRSQPLAAAVLLMHFAMLHAGVCTEGMWRGLCDEQPEHVPGV